MIKRLVSITCILTFSLAFTAFNGEASRSSSEIVKHRIPEPVILSEEEKIEKLYEEFSAVNAVMPSITAFSSGITGYQKLLKENRLQKELLSIVDFSLPSTEKRLWIMDMTTKKVLFHTYVSHGKNTGGNMATDFSNTPNSLQSSLGFFVTAETYYGRNGLSLFIDGMEKEFNSNARSRYVVIHGADYATASAIKRLGRLGRSYGCPAVPTKLSKDIIHTIKGKSALFIYHSDKDYLDNSKYLDQSAV